MNQIILRDVLESQINRLIMHVTRLDKGKKKRGKRKRGWLVEEWSFS